MESSIYKPNRYVLNLFLMPLFEWIGPVLIPLVLLMAVVYSLVTRNCKFCLYIGFLLSVSLGVHWMIFRMLGAKLPMERTAIFIPLLVTFFVLAAAASVPTSKIGTVLHALLLTAIVVLAVYFGSCLRLSYFKEWEWDAEVRQAYMACRNYKGTVVSSWYYTSPLNFYRWMLHDDKTPEIRDGNPTPPGDVYVLHGLFDAELIDARRLKVVFKGDYTDIVVAIPAAP